MQEKTYGFPKDFPVASNPVWKANFLIFLENGRFLQNIHKIFTENKQIMLAFSVLVGYYIAVSTHFERVLK